MGKTVRMIKIKPSQADEGAMILKQRERDLHVALERSKASGPKEEQSRLQELISRVKANIQRMRDEREYKRIRAEESEFEFRAAAWRRAFNDSKSKRTPSQSERSQSVPIPKSLIGSSTPWRQPDLDNGLPRRRKRKLK